MSILNLAEGRALTALERLERLLRSRPASEADTASVAVEERSAIERDCELLRRECDSLRREVESLRAHQSRLVAVVDEVDDRLEGAIGQLDELARE